MAVKALTDACGIRHTYDVRALIDATVKLRDGKKITDMDLPLIPRLAMKEALKKIEGTDLEKFLKEYNAI